MCDGKKYKRPESIKGLPSSEIIEFFECMDFRDPLGHPLTLNQDFLDLIHEIEEIRSCENKKSFSSKVKKRGVEKPKGPGPRFILR